MNLLLRITLLLGAAVCVAAQAPDIVIGVIHDSRAAVIGGATVKCADSSVTSASDANGGFSLVCHSRRIIVTAAGFETSDVTASAANVVIDLQPLPISATVDVTRAGSTLASSPASVAVVGGRQLETSAALSLDDKLRQVPGFTLFRRAGSTTANPTAQGVSLRGVGASGASRALVLNEGVPLNDPFGGWVYWGRVPGRSISEVELIRGAASDLYGSSAIGGVISVVNRPPAAHPFGDLDVAYGSDRSPYASFFGGAGIAGYIGSLAAEGFRTDGFIPTAPESRGPVDTAANVGRYSLRPRVEYHSGTSTVVFVAPSMYQERRKNGSPLQNNDTRLVELISGIDTTTKHLGTFSARLYGLTEKYHQSFSAIAANRQTESLNRLQTVPSQALGSSLQWTGSIRRQVIFAGADIRQIRGRSDETSISNGVATSLSSSGGRETTFGSFAGGIVNVRKVTLGGGIRYDWWRDSRGYSATRTIAGGAGQVTPFSARSESRLSPRASALVRVTPHISVSGVISTAFRQPTLNELYRGFRVGNVLTLANASLTAERAINGEAALIVDALDQRLYIRTGPYCLRLTNAVSNVTLSATPSLITRQRQNLGSTRSCGLEADVKFDPSGEWSISASYLHVNSTVTGMPGNEALVGLQLAQVPRDQFTTSLRYSPSRVGIFSVQFRSSTSQWDDDLNTLRLAPYSVVDLYASRKVTHWADIYLAVENASGSRVESGRTPVLTLAQPRVLRIGMRLNFTKR